MKVVRLCQYFYTKNVDSGLKPYFYYLVKELKKIGVEHVIITLESDSRVIDGERIYVLPHRKPLTLLSLPKVGVKAYRKIGEIDFDLLHTHLHGFFSLYHYKKKIGKPMVHTLHTTPFAYKYRLEWRGINQMLDNLSNYLCNRYACRRADAVVTVSTEDRRRIINEFKVGPEKVYYIPTGTDPDLFRPRNVEKDIDLLYVGRFAPKKALPLLLKVVRELVEENKIRACLIGGTSSDPGYKAVIDSVKKFNLGRNVDIIEPVSQEKLVGYYNRAKIFVLASYHEGMPKVILEAMACGLPVIATDVCGNRDAVVDGRTGFLIPAGDPKILKEKLGELLRDEDLREGMGKMGRKRIEKYFTWENIARQTSTLYRKLVPS